MTTVTRVFGGSYTADPNHSSFEAGTRHMGVGLFRARFDQVEATLTESEAGLHLEGRAAVASISIKNPPEFREHVVNGADFFDAGNYPEIRFASDEIEIGDDDQIVVRGRLTIKDKTRPITAPGSYRGPLEDPYGNTRAAIDLATRIDRREFGLDWQAKLPNGGDVLGWQIDIDVHLELIKD
jgi:polyisoprenoid-binding protein YceI